LTSPPLPRAPLRDAARGCGRRAVLFREETADGLAAGFIPRGSDLTPAAG